jgi:hypothetical protein
MGLHFDRTRKPRIVRGVGGNVVLTPSKAGPTGRSAYQIAVENGFSGTEAEWLASLVGGVSTTVAIDTDGVPYYDAAVSGGVLVLTDTDGVPYINA